MTMWTQIELSTRMSEWGTWEFWANNTNVIIIIKGIKTNKIDRNFLIHLINLQEKEVSYQELRKEKQRKNDLNKCKLNILEIMKGM